MVPKHTILWAFAGMMVLLGAGCENKPGQPVNLFDAGGGSEKWTIRCRRMEGPGHVEQVEMLAKMLRQVKQLKADQVRVVSDANGSTVYYGQYRRVASSTSDQLAFPPEFLKDIEFIRSLSYGPGSSPFLTAQPELIDTTSASKHPEWEATNSAGTHSLLIAVFYNTPTFSQRKETAEQYVELLRQDGFPAYYYHEAVKSFVFVGDFTAQDIVNTPEGAKPGPRVEQMIARREDEFRHFTENGHFRKSIEAPGKEVIPLTQVVPMPRKDQLTPR
jgi:hypothetical protein